MDDTFRPRFTKRQDPTSASNAGKLRLAINPSPDETEVQVAFLCDLPGFGGPWLTQYAHKTARRVGPVVVLHVDPDRIELELVSGRDPAHTEPAAKDAKDGVAPISDWIHSGKATLPEVLSRLARLEDQPISHWIVALPADRSRETRAIAREFVRWTLLAGGQSLSIEDAAEVLRDLVDGDADAAERQVSLSLMGSGPDAGDGALDRVNSLLKWSGELKLAEGQTQMMPVQTDWLGGFDWTPGDWSALYRFFEPWGGMIREHSAPSIPVAISPVSVSASAAISQPGIDLSAYACATPCVRLEARCPRDATTQLAIDDQGGLHLLRQHQSGSPTNAVEEVRAALADMLATQAWVREHLALLQLTRPDRVLDATKTPVIHVLTNQGKAGVDLVQRFGSMAKIHLLQEVPGAGRVPAQAAMWVHTELN